MKRFTAILAPLALVACQTVAEPQPVPEPPPVVEAEPAPVEETAPPPAPEAPAPVEETAPVEAKQTYVQYRKSALVSALVSESIMNDDVALMGILSGARAYCGLDWQPGFVTFINLANRQGLVLETVAEDHGFYLGAARRALTDAEYKCNQQDLVDLRAIEPY